MNYRKSSGVDRTKFIPQRDKIKDEIIIKERNDLTEKQKQLIELILDKKTRIVFINGPAGTAKTWCAVYVGLLFLNKKLVSDICYIRSVIESASRSLGFLPGDSDEKLEPFLMPLMDKLEEFLDKSTINNLIKEKRIQGLPVNFLRGASYNTKFIIADEAQNFDKKELTTIITRLGEFSKLVILADPSQSDLNGKSGFMPFYDLFNDESSRNQGIYCFSFTKNDIVRNGILKYIIDRIENLQSKSEPMFKKK